ncbi:L-rhamnose mutarotase [Pelagicoccus mobilis]|uniref:L-rhamnose mutarotase n=1 Tax=Pelagicoccus mobilis TaxID=415221 RepID=A0A934VN37_9BACT|nr:L-rhamnose mutarotase [Pelagicoccus mobilis]MBK1875827.1 L-rhamnose mutarotase [Pelagicoccus mobilis]
MSPYENRLNSENFRRIGLLAEIRPDSLAEVADLVSSGSTDLAKDLEHAGIRNLAIYQKAVGDLELVFLYFETIELDQEKAILLLKESSAWWSTLEGHLLAHPRATKENHPWVRCEFMNVIAIESEFDRNKGDRIALVSQLIPEKELWYRTLHQTNWPGVVDQMRRSNFQNWTTFLIEWGESLLLFSYVEYVGKDREADESLMAADPVTQRWWTHTQPCLSPVEGSNDAWSAMERKR